MHVAGMELELGAELPDLEVAAIDAAMRTTPLTPAWLRDAAERCVAADAGVAEAIAQGRIQDRRWRRALTRAARSVGAAGEATRPDALERVWDPPPDHRLTEIVGRPGEWLLSTSTRSDGGAYRRALRRLDTNFGELATVPLPDGAGVMLPRAMFGAQARVVSVLQPGDDQRDTVAELRELGEDLQPTRVTSLAITGHPSWIAHTDAGWLLMGGDFVFLPDGTMLPRCEYGLRGPGPIVLEHESQAWLLTAGERFFRAEGPQRGWSTETAHWVNLHTGDATTLPWEYSHGFSHHRGTVWGTSDRGLWRAPLGGAPELVWEKEGLYAIGVTDEAVFVTDRRAGRLLVCDHDLRVRAEVADVPLFQSPDVGPYGAVFGWSEFVWVRPDGEVGARSGDAAPEERSERICHDLDGRTLAVSGREALLLPPDGAGEARRISLPMPCTLYGEAGGAWIAAARSSPYGLVAVFPDGSMEHVPTEQPMTPEPIVYGDGSTGDRGALTPDQVLLSNTRALWRWRPRRPRRVQLPKPTEVREHVGQRQPGFHTYNPRDDWPVPGLSATDEDVVAREGVYGGTWGVAEAPGVQLRTGSHAVLVDCTIKRGVDLAQGSTLWLVRCTLEGGAKISDDSWLVLVDTPAPEDHPRVRSIRT